MSSTESSTDLTASARRPVSGAFAVLRALLPGGSAPNQGSRRETRRIVVQARGKPLIDALLEPRDKAVCREYVPLGINPFAVLRQRTTDLMKLKWEDQWLLRLWAAWAITSALRDDGMPEQTFPEFVDATPRPAYVGALQNQAMADRYPWMVYPDPSLTLQDLVRAFDIVVEQGVRLDERASSTALPLHMDNGVRRAELVHHTPRTCLKRRDASRRYPTMQETLHRIGQVQSALGALVRGDEYPVALGTTVVGKPHAMAYLSGRRYRGRIALEVDDINVVDTHFRFPAIWVPR